MHHPELYSIQEARKLLGGISRNTIYQLLRSGELASVVIGCRRFTSAAEKTRFATLAHAAGISESRLALMAIRAFVDEDGRTQGPPAHDPAAERVRATDRITIRLRPGDGAVIARRAAERGMKTSTYL